MIDPNFPATPFLPVKSAAARSHHTPAGEKVRALFLSDVHLGSPHSSADEFLALLNRYRPEKLFLVGDILDGRRLKKFWHWPKVYNQILNRFADLLSNGTIIYYTPGNHDEFMRDLLPSLPQFVRSDQIRIADEFLYESHRKARLLVTHGDQFDHHEQAAGFVSAFVTVVYDWLLRLDGGLTRFFPQRKRSNIARWAKRQSSKVQQFVEQFEETAANYAERGGYDGIICGHVHEPKIVSRSSISYCNTGDWVEHCSALIEQTTGDWELTFFNPKHYSSAKTTESRQSQSRSSTWSTIPPRDDVQLTLLKSNRWTHRHSFPEKTSETGCPQVNQASGNQSDAASQEKQIS